MLVPGSGAAQGTFVEALTGGETWIDARYRLERVEQDNPLEDATASTLRTRLGYQTGAYRGFSLLLEVSNTWVVGSDAYDSTANGKTHRSMVADPETTRFNRYHLDFTGLPDTTLRLGRQRIPYDNHRLVGNVGFRQTPGSSGSPARSPSEAADLGQRGAPPNRLLPFPFLGSAELPRYHGVLESRQRS